MPLPDLVGLVTAMRSYVVMSIVGLLTTLSFGAGPAVASSDCTVDDGCCPDSHDHCCDASITGSCGFTCQSGKIVHVYLEGELANIVAVCLGGGVAFCQIIGTGTCTEAVGTENMGELEGFCEAQGVAVTKAICYTTQ